MEIKTKKQVLSTLIERVKNQYPTDYRLYGDRMSNDIIKELEAETELTEKRAIEILGNESWTCITCYECQKNVNATVQLGRDSDYNSSTANICFDCLNKAVSLLGTKNETAIIE